MLDDETNVFKDFAVASKFNVQNEQAYVQEDSMRMISDAELTRKAWRVPYSWGEKDDNDTSNEDFLLEILPVMMKNIEIIFYIFYFIYCIIKFCKAIISNSS